MASNVRPAFGKRCGHCSRSEDQSSLQTCAQCYKSPYCSRDCQRADWPSHKALCRLTREHRDSVKRLDREVKPEMTRAMTSAGLGTVSGSLRQLHSTMESWLQINLPAFRDSAIQAMNLRRTPDRIFTHMVVFDVTPNRLPMVEALPENPAQAFSLKTVEVSSIEEETAGHYSPEQTQEAFAGLLRRSRQSRDKGYLGILFLLIKAPTISHRRLVALDLDWRCEEAGYPVDRHWEQTLRNALALAAMSIP